MSSRLLLCVFFAVLSYATLNIGLVLEKRGADLLPAIEKTGLWQNLKNFLTNPTWLIGFILTNVQGIPFFAAVSLGPLSLVSPMIGVGLLVLLAFSVWYLKERVTLPMYGGIALTVVGVAVFGAASTGNEVRFSWDDTLTLMAQGRTIAFLVVLTLTLGIPLGVTLALRYRYADVLCGLASGVAASLGMIFSKLAMAGIDPEHVWQSLAVSCTRLPFYLFVALLLAGNGCSMVLQQLGFQKGKAIVLAPVFTVSCIIFPALTGVVVFAEWDGYSMTLIAAKLFAMTLLLAGVGILSFYNARQRA